MKRLLLDVSVLLDVILDRTEAPTAAALWAALERGSGEGPQGFPEAPVRVLDPGTALAWLTE